MAPSIVQKSADRLDCLHGLRGLAALGVIALLSYLVTVLIADPGIRFSKWVAGRYAR